MSHANTHTYNTPTKSYTALTHIHTLPFLLRSNLLVSIPLSLLSLSPTGPEIINLFLHSSYVSTIPPPSCFFFLQAKHGLLLSVNKCTWCAVYFVGETKRWVFCEVKREKKKRKSGPDREKEKLAYSYLGVCVAALLYERIYVACVYVVVTWAGGLMARVAALINLTLMNFTWLSRMT